MLKETRVAKLEQINKAITLAMVEPERRIPTHTMRGVQTLLNIPISLYNTGRHKSAYNDSHNTINPSSTISTIN
eukprot:10765802-Ditylum_brightwellii.AAC.1